MSMFKGYWKRHLPGSAMSGYRAFQHERLIERAMWRWRSKRGKGGWIWCERLGYRLGVLRRGFVKDENK